MPEMDGWEATATLRERGVRIAIIALTASALPGERERCLTAGIDEFLTKPLDLKTLAETLARWLPAAGPLPVDGPDSNSAHALPLVLQIRRQEHRGRNARCEQRLLVDFHGRKRVRFEDDLNSIGISCFFTNPSTSV